MSNYITIPFRDVEVYCAEHDLDLEAALELADDESLSLGIVSQGPADAPLSMRYLNDNDISRISSLHEHMINRDEHGQASYEPMSDDRVFRVLPQYERVAIIREAITEAADALECVE